MGIQTDTALGDDFTNNHNGIIPATGEITVAALPDPSDMVRTGVNILQTLMEMGIICELDPDTTAIPDNRLQTTPGTRLA